MRVEMGDQLQKQRRLTKQLILLVKAAKEEIHPPPPPSPVLEAKKTSFDHFEEAWRNSGDPYAAQTSISSQDFTDELEEEEKMKTKKREGKPPVSRRSMVIACRDHKTTVDDFADTYLDDDDD